MTRTPLRLAPFALLALAACGSSSAATQTAQAPQQTQTAPKADETEQKLKAAIDAPSRPAEERARDKYRHPLETLEFFGLKDDMTVVELSPGKGWYSAILAPVVKDKGKWVGTSSDPNGPPDKESTKNALALQERIKSHPDVFGQSYDIRVIHGPEDFNLGPDGSADMVLTFRNIHGWLRDDGKMWKVVVAAVWKVLKPGGVFGVVEHRAKPGADWHDAPKTGYVPVEFVKSELQQAGFQLAGESEVNANPNDTKDYEKGVWALPPTLENGDTDKDKYLAIGESDRMTLKFVKPAK